MEFFGHFVIISNGYHFTLVDTLSRGTFSSNKNENEAHKSNIIDVRMSKCFSYIASVDEDKQLKIWKGTKAEWKLTNSYQIVKRASKMAFGNNELLVADRFGDVYSFGLETNVSKMLMGHVSQITDIVCSENVIVTSDRDEKIRVTRYPETFVIETYLLGHLSFVSSICFLNEFLLSGGGDPDIYLWDVKSGKCISKANVIDFLKSQHSNSEIEELGCKSIKAHLNNFAVILDNFNGCLVGTFECDKISFVHIIVLDSPASSICFDINGILWISMLNGTCKSYLSDDGGSDQIIEKTKWMNSLLQPQDPENIFITKLYRKGDFSHGDFPKKKPKLVEE
jgi:tRNA (guanine-N(7)-)-methyltransferase subunit TRM82